MSDEVERDDEQEPVSAVVSAETAEATTEAQ